MTLTNAQKVRLGAFLLFGAAILVGSLTWVAGAKFFERRAVYYVRYTDSVTGLESSAQVKYSGLTVGRVEKLRIAPDDPQAIEVTLTIDPEVKLYEGTRARLDMSGITGLRIINLVGGDPRAKVLEPGSTLPADGGGLGKIVDQAESVAQRVNEIAAQLQRWASDDNRKRLESILTSMDSFLRTADKTMSDNSAPFGTAVTQMGEASREVALLSAESTATLRAVRADLEASLGAVRQQIENVDPKALAATVNATRGVMTKLEKRMSDEEAGQALQNLGAAMVQVTKLLQELDLAVRASREDFTATMASMREAAEDLREFSRMLAQDPSVIVRGRDLE